MRRLAEDIVFMSTSTATLVSAIKAMAPIAENFLPSVDPLAKQMHPDDGAAGFLVANMQSRGFFFNPSAASDQPRAFLRLIEEACPLLEPQIEKLRGKLTAETADRKADRGGMSEAASEVLGAPGGAGIFRNLGVGFLQPPAQTWSPGVGAGHTLQWRTAALQRPIAVRQPGATLRPPAVRKSPAARRRARGQEAKNRPQRLARRCPSWSEKPTPRTRNTTWPAPRGLCLNT